MKTLVVDNYDSFTHNLVHLLAVVNQEDPIVIRNDEVEWAELDRWSFDNVVISPGPGRPDRTIDFGICARLISDCARPLLGVCLGHQGIAAMAGGAVVRAPSPTHGKASRVTHHGVGLFHSIPSPIAVARYHSLIAHRPLPGSLMETAWTDDGLIMGLAHRIRPLWGVQFHPESIITEHGRTLIENFRNMTRRAAPRRTSEGWNGRLSQSRASQPASASVSIWQEIPHAIDAEAAFVRLFGTASTAFWLDSSLIEAGRSRWSYFGDASGPGAGLYTYDAVAQHLDVLDASGRRHEQTSVFDHLDHSLPATVENPPPCPFTGGYVGWLGYELGRECGGDTLRKSETPDALLLRVGRFVAVDHRDDRTYVVSVGDRAGLEDARLWVDAMAERLAQIEPVPAPQMGARTEPIHFRLDRDRATYLADIDQCLEWIRQGETYQVCLTNEITAAVDMDPLVLYRILRRVNPAPYAAFLRWPGGAVLSASPERFLHADAHGQVEAKPIKGTIKRHANAVLDRQFAQRLGTSEKDRAENVMIVDLLRNDLSRVCEPGSVVVPKLCNIESYATVHQLVSTIQGRLSDGRSIVDLVRASFPGGSMTGAPKVRTLQLIDRLEQRARGIYSGALGWFGNNGGGELSIVIRTIVQTNGCLSIGVGGGVVAQSTPQGEFEEMLLKAEASIRAVVLAATGSFDADRYILEGADDVCPGLEHAPQIAG
ncbi:aminodeoxychorismate synthase component I [Aquabacter sp. CN5-332]|uniref:aminodeoxychorismate synthase component I n=1 Tax=Aquabacter sp. CN5-332 TaxID=3156608 RepID=UPI0032B3C917